jgi:hypothetical protein
MIDGKSNKTMSENEREPDPAVIKSCRSNRYMAWNLLFMRSSAVAET